MVRLSTDMGLPEAPDYVNKLKRAEKMRELRDQVRRPHGLKTRLEAVSYRFRGTAHPLVVAPLMDPHRAPDLRVLAAVLEVPVVGSHSRKTTAIRARSRTMVRSDHKVDVCHLTVSSYVQMSATPILWAQRLSVRRRLCDGAKTMKILNTKRSEMTCCRSRPPIGDHVLYACP